MRILLLAMIVGAILVLRPPPFLAPDSPASDCRRVLFIGNSLTFSHDIPANTQRLANLLAYRGSLCVEQEVVAGATLEWHWDNGRARRLLDQPWDDVVLQEQTDRAYDQPDAMGQWVERFAPKVKQSGARMLLYAIMSNTRSAQDQRLLTFHMARIAGQSNATVVPVGAVWSDLLTADPAAPIFEPDRHHPGQYGAYSAALLFARCLVGPLREPAAYMLVEGRPISTYRLLLGRADIVQAAVDAAYRAVERHAGGCERS